MSIVLEHLGLIEAQICDSRNPEVTSFMHPAPYPNKDQTHTHEDSIVADPLSEATLSLWMKTARVNREIFTELFRPLPSNLVRNWAAYDVGTFCEHRVTQPANFMPLELSLQVEDRTSRTWHSVGAC